MTRCSGARTGPPQAATNHTESERRTEGVMASRVGHNKGVDNDSHRRLVKKDILHSPAMPYRPSKGKPLAKGDDLILVSNTECHLSEDNKGNVRGRELGCGTLSLFFFFFFVVLTTKLFFTTCLSH